MGLYRVCCLRGPTELLVLRVLSERSPWRPGTARCAAPLQQTFPAPAPSPSASPWGPWVRRPSVGHTRGGDGRSGGHRGMGAWAERSSLGMGRAEAVSRAGVPSSRPRTCCCPRPAEACCHSNFFKVTYAVFLIST